MVGDVTYRQLCNLGVKRIKTIQEMPIDELHKLIEFTKTDPNSEHSKRILWDNDYPDWQKRQIYELRNQDVILYEAECDLP